MLRLRSDEQLVALVRCGYDEAFQVIHDRYRQRLFAYMRQMLPLRQDAEDALQEVFERAYAGLHAGDRELALRPWLYRIAHNRCIDHLRRPAPPPPEAMLALSAPPRDPVTEADCRETLRRLLSDVRRLPAQQRSALLMRELGGISYADVGEALGVTVPAVKSLLVRARVSLAAAGEARDTACDEIRAELVTAHEGRVRPNSMARRHLRDCAGCREFRGHLRGMRRTLLAAAPGLAPCGLLARLLGGGGTSSAAGGSAAAAAGGAGAGASGLAGTSGLFASAGAVVSGAGHVATLLAATVVTAGGAAALSHSAARVIHSPHPRAAALVAPRVRAPTTASATKAAPSAATSAPVAPVAPALTSAPVAVVRSTTATAPRLHHSPGTVPAPEEDNSLGPIPDPGAPSSTPSSSTGSPSPDPTATGSQSDPGTSTPTATPSTGTPTPAGGTTGPTTGTPTPTTTPTPTGGSQPPAGGTPTTGTPTPTGTGAGTGSPPPSTGTGSPSGSRSLS